MAPYSPLAASKYPSPNLDRPVMTGIDVRGKGSVGDVSKMSAQPEEAEVARPFEKIFGDHLNVLDFIRPGEFANVGFDRAIAILKARPNGGCLIVPNRGTDYKFNYQVVLYSNIKIIGIGMPHISFDSTNIRAAFITDQFDLLSGGNDRGPVAYASIDGVYIDGEWSTGLGLGDLPQLPDRFAWDPRICKRDGIAMFGQGCSIKNVYVFACRGNGIHYSYAIQGAATPFDGHISNVTINRTGEHGFVHDFSDAHINDLNISTPSRATRGASCGMYCRGGFHGVNINIFIGGSTPSRPMYSIWLRTGGGSDFTMGTMESGVYGGVRIDTIRTKINTKAHSPVGYAPYVIRARLTEITGHIYKGAQAGAATPIAPFVIGGLDPVDPSVTFAQRPTGCKINLICDGFDAPIDLTYSGGFNEIRLRGSYGYLPAPDDDPTEPPRGWQGKQVIAGYTSTCDTLDLDFSDVGNEGPWSMQARPMLVLAAAGTTSGTAALIRSTIVRLTSDAPNKGARLQERLPGVMNYVFNDSTFSIFIYPHAAGKFIGKGLSEPVELLPGKGACFFNLGPDWGFSGI